MNDAPTPDLEPDADRRRQLLSELLLDDFRDGRSNLSFAQQRIWFLDRLTQDNPQHCSIAFEIRGSFDQQTFDRALTETVARHSVLRTSLREVGGRALAVIADAVPVRARAEIVEDGLLDQRIADEARAPFTLDRPPLLRAVVFAVGTGRRVLLLTAHEVVADRASLHVLAEELATAYRALHVGAPVILPDVHTQYGTYAARQRQRQGHDATRAQLAYWRRQLAGLRPPDLPTDRRRPSSQTFAGGRAVRTFPATLVDGIRGLAGHDGDRLDIVLLAAFAALLGRNSGCVDLAIGLSSPNRRDPNLDRLVGPLSDLRVVRTDLGGDPPFRRLLGRVRDTVLEGEANRDVPFERLIEELSPDRDLSRPPLCQLAVEVGHQPAALDLGDAQLVPLDVDWHIAKLDLELSALRDDNGDLVTRLVYNADLYDHTTAASMLEQLHRLLDTVVADADRPLSAVSLFDPAEGARIRRLSAGVEMDLGGRLVHELVEQQARTSPGAVAVAVGESTLTYRDLDRQSNRIARRLRLLGVGVDDRVGVFCHRSPELVVALLAVLKAGAAYVPVDPAHPAARNARILSDARVTAILTESSLTSPLDELVATLPDGLDAETVVVDHADDLADDGLDPRASLSDLAYLIYTSGSTGTPKGVMVTHGGLLNYVVWAAREYGVAAGADTLLHSSIAFDLTVTSLFPALIRGRTVRIVADDSGAGSLMNALRHDDASLVKLTPAHLDLISELSTVEGVDLPARRVVVGGEALHGETVRRWAERAPETTIVNEYGPTETVVGCCAHAVQAGDVEAGPVPIGRPIANTRLYVLDESLRPTPFGAPGELYVGGMGVARGYFGKPELTAERFVLDPFSDRPDARLYRTGDVVRYRADGNLVYVGRADFQIKLRGYRIEPGEIEAALNEHPAVRQSTVVAREDTPGDRRLVAYLVTDGANVAHAELGRHLAQRLPDYMVPAAFVALSALPLTPNGKVDRAALPAVQTARPEVSTAFSKPRTRLETDVAREFAALLDVETIGLDDDFLELGGHSLLLAQLASRLSHAYEVTIPVSRLFATPTVRGVSQLIEVCANEGTEAAAAMADRVDLLSEAEVEPELTPAGLPQADHDDPRRVLLTGVTGFLGAHLLRELLEQTQAEVWCLVRASDDARARDRVERTLRQYRMWDASFRPRIKGVPGDIAKPRLGLSTERFELLAATVDSIYHSAALVNFVYPYSTLKAPNVGGTKTLLELACLTRAKAFHHISAVDVFVRGEDRTLYEADPLEPRDVPAGYIQSKWVAEKMVATVRDRGLPVTIYRPWIILGHSAHGSAHTTDYTCVFLKGCVQLRAAPDIPMTLNVMPADYVSRAIVHISRQPAGRGGIFHFANPHAEDLSTVWDWVRGYGYDLARMSYREWHAKARTVSPDNALYKILPILIDGEEDLDTVSPENFRPRIDTSHTDAVLAGSGIECPPVSRELCDKVLDYLTDVDFLESPYDRSVL